MGRSPLSYADRLPTTGTLEPLAALLEGRRALALSGAGISTESGIPDYRGPNRRSRPQPMRYQQFVRSEAARRRYWARSLQGWPLVAAARPNRGHRALAQLEAGGVVSGVLTQNVDGLHQAAGSRAVLELHGSLAVVRCLECGALERRSELQRRLLALNPGLRRHGARRAPDEARPDGAHQALPDGAPPALPDGDAEIDEALLESVRVPACRVCGGVLKPDVVFFGENVPRPRLERAWEMLAQADALLVVGSSLTVFSGYRFVARAAAEGKPVMILNDGPTRGDELAAVRLAGRLGELLPALAGRLLAGGATS